MHWLLPKLKGVPVLMYHHVWPGTPDYMTVTPVQLEEQLSYLKSEGYKTVFASTLVQSLYNNEELPEKTIVLTFDDGYCNQVKYVQPLLRKFGFCASLFLIGEKVINTKNSGKEDKNDYLTLEHIGETDKDFFEFGLHSYSHRPVGEMSKEEVRTDLIRNQQTFSALNITAVPVFAYPYGNRPSKKKEVEEVKNVFRECGIVAAFRIGNGVVPFPAKDLFELKRIDINGFDTMKRFRIKLKKGKLKPF